MCYPLLSLLYTFISPSCACRSTGRLRASESVVMTHSAEEPPSSTIAAANELTASAPATSVENKRRSNNNIFSVRVVPSTRVSPRVPVLVAGDKSSNSPPAQHTLPAPLGEHMVTRPGAEMMPNDSPPIRASATTALASTPAQNAVTPPRVVDAASAAAPKKRRGAPNKGWSPTRKKRARARYKCEKDLRLARVIKVKVDQRGDPFDTSCDATIDEGTASDAGGAAAGWRWQLGKACRDEDEEEGKRGETNPCFSCPHSTPLVVPSLRHVVPSGRLTALPCV